MRIIRIMSTTMAMSTTTIRTTLIGSPRLVRIARRNIHVMNDGCYLEKQGTEILHESGNTISEMSELEKVADYKLADFVISYDELYESMLKSKKGVSWKPSVKQVIINSSREILNLHDKLKNGEWKNKIPKEVNIFYPKRRVALSIPFKDRIYQRSLNDNVLYPQMTRSFVDSNCACQKGKGTDYAMNLLRLYLRRFYINNGLNGYILQIDIKKYYETIPHDEAEVLIKDKIYKDIAEMAVDVLRKQYKEESGYKAGSQMVQILGISYLNNVDHFIKEKLGIKEYVRYNDDFIMLHKSKEYLEYCLGEIIKKLKEKGLEISEKKTKIIKISEKFRFLGFDWKITNLGKILSFVKSESVKHEKKKLYRLVNKAEKEKADECYNSWKAHAKRGNFYSLEKRLDRYYNCLWENKE